MLKTTMSVIGSIFPAVAIAAIYFLIGVDWSALGIIVGVCAALSIVSYILAAVGATSSFGEFMRGWLIGLNAALNAVLGYALVATSGNIAAAVIVALALGAINLLCVLGPLSQSGFYQGVLGWLNWLMPMSWLVVALGFVFYVVSFLLHAVTGGKVAYLRIEKLGADWKTGTFFIKGGLISNLNHHDTAFNMGNFSFVDYKSGDWHKEHEAGHTLNLAAFGSLFHLVGALDENVLRGRNAYAERLAESNATGTMGSNIPMWA
jgi:hypothetical protein